MRSIKPITILLLVCFFSHAVFSQTNPVLDYLPANAKVIFKINPHSLGQRIKWSELLEYKFFKDLLKEAPGDGKGFLADPSQTGIDLDQGIIVSINDLDKKAAPIPVLYCVPKDTAKFAAMIRTLATGSHITKVPKGNILTSKESLIAWNNEIIMISGAKKFETVKGPNGIMPNKIPASTITKELTEKGKALLTKQSAGSARNEKFLSLLQQDGDILFWTDNSFPSKKNTEALPPAFSMLNKNLMFQGMYSASVINFENGEIVMKMKQYVSESMDSLYQKYPFKNINVDIAKKLPAGQPIALGFFTLSPEMLKEVYAQIGFDKVIDSMTKHKIQINEMLPAIKGDLMLGVIKADEIDRDDSMTQAMNGLQIFLAGGIGDKEKFEKLAGMLQEKKQDVAMENRPPKMKPVILSDASTFVVSLSEKAAKTFLAAQGTNNDMEKFLSSYKNSPAFFMIDLKTIFSFAFQAAAKGKSDEEMQKASEVMGMFDKMIIYGGQYENRSTQTTMKLTLTNKEKNSLRQFLDLIDLFYSMKPKNSKAFNQNQKGKTKPVAAKSSI